MNTSFSLYIDQTDLQILHHNQAVLQLKEYPKVLCFSFHIPSQVNAKGYMTDAITNAIVAMATQDIFVQPFFLCRKEKKILHCFKQHNNVISYTT